MSGAALHHLNLRVAWHDTRWNGHVCRMPSKNTFCIDLDRIRAERNEAKEDALCGKAFWELEDGEFPPCQADSGAFMNDKTWWRTFKHPYQEIPRASTTHGKLTKTSIKVPPYLTFAVPFRWMLREYGEGIEGGLPSALPPDERAPFPTPWIFSRERQIALWRGVFRSHRRETIARVLLHQEWPPPRRNHQSPYRRRGPGGLDISAANVRSLRRTALSPLGSPLHAFHPNGWMAWNAVALS